MVVSLYTLVVVLVPTAAIHSALASVPELGDGRLLISVSAGAMVGGTLGWWTYGAVARWLDPTPRCRCGYDIRGLTSGLCPECGRVTIDT